MRMDVMIEKYLIIQGRTNRKEKETNMAKGKIYVMGIDQMVLPLTEYFIKEGSVPTLANFSHGALTDRRLLPSRAGPPTTGRPSAPAPRAGPTGLPLGLSVCPTARMSLP